MKHVKLLFMTLALLLVGTVGSRAAEGPYSWNFDTAINTGAHDFKVASNWKHIVHKYVDSYSFEYFMTYSYSATGGVDGSGALLAYEQRAGDNYDYEYTHDLLVTPVVQGRVSLKVKSYNSKGYVEFYTLNETGTKDETLIKKFTAGTNYNEDGYTEISIDVEDARRIGIRASYVYLDDFAAEYAVTEPEKSMVILTAEPSNTSGQIKWDQQADKSVLVKFTNVTVMNNGEADLTQGESKFSVSVINGKTNEVLGRVKVPQDLKMGETSEPFEVTATITEDKIRSLWSYSGASANIYLMEDLQGSIVKRALSYYNPYESKFVFKEKGSTSSSSLSSAIDFGMISEAVTKEYLLVNDGVAPLQIVSVSVPQGYESNFPAGEFVVPGHGQQAIALTLPATTMGAFSGVLEIVYVDNSGNNKTYSLDVKGNVVGANTWFTDFNTPGSSSVTYPDGSVAEAGVQSGYEYAAGAYDSFLKSYTNSDYADANNKFITPRLHAQAGDVMTFDVARESDGEKYNLKVYVSKDRVNWGEPVAVIGYGDLNDKKFVNRSISFDEEGDYYVAFAVYGMKLDNIVGLQKVDVDHDIYIYKVTQNDLVQSGQKFDAKVEVIAPVKSRAGDYTVKYYVDGKVAATIDSKALSANARSTVTFSTSINPEVEKTTVFPTYFEFAFTDGTVFKSPVKDLKVTNDPWFVFVKEGTTVNYDHQATNYNSAIDFGMGNKTGLVQKFEVLNWGTAPLEVKSITVPDGFSVNVDKATVEGKMRQAVDVTFSAAEAGSYGGKLAIVYVDANGEDVTFELDVKGVMLDPNKWYASFDNEAGSSTGEWPLGSLHQSEIQLTKDSNFPTVAMYGSGSASSEKKLFTTPLLRAAAGETFSFEARTYSTSWPEGVVNVYAAKSREDLANPDARLNLGSWSGRNVDDEHLLTPEFKTITVALEEAGDYYLGFEVYSRVRVDNIYGLSLVDVAHELMMTSTTIPAEAVQNKESIARVAVLNIGLNAEEDASYTVATYVNGVKCADVDGMALPVVSSLADKAVEMEVPFRSPKAGTYPVYVEIAFADGYTVKSEPVDVAFAEETLSNEVVVGTPSAYENVPCNLNYNNSEGISLYTPAELGLSGGEKIKSITLKGYYDKKDVNTKLKVAYMWTDESTLANPSGSSAYDATGMTICYDDNYDWPTGGSRTDVIDLIKITFDQPIVYEQGKSLKLLVSAYTTAFKAGLTFELSNGGQTYYHQKDGSQGTFAGSNWLKKNSPVLHMDLDVDPVAYGASVVDTDGNAVEGAVVTLVSNDGDNVQYEGTTDAEGKCSINVIQSGRDYDVVVKTADGEAYVDGVNFANGSLDAQIKLLPVFNIADDSEHTQGKPEAVVYLNSVFEPGFNAIALPIALTAEEVVELFGEDATVMEFVNDETDGTNIKAHFETVSNGMEAGKPYLVYMLQATTPKMYKNKEVVDELKTVNGNSVDFVPATKVTPMEAGMVLLGLDNFDSSSNVAPMAANSAVVLPYRAYMKVPVGNGSFTFVNDQYFPTGIEEITPDDVESEDVIYNLQGIRVYNPVKGNIYIVNGKAVYLR